MLEDMLQRVTHVSEINVKLAPQPAFYSPY